MSTQVAQDQQDNLEKQENENYINSKVENPNRETTPITTEDKVETSSVLEKKQLDQDGNKQTPDQSGDTKNTSPEKKNIIPENGKEEKNGKEIEEGNNTSIKANDKVENSKQASDNEKTQHVDQENNENKILEKENAGIEKQEESQPQKESHEKSLEKQETPKQENEIKEGKESSEHKDENKEGVIIASSQETKKDDKELNKEKEEKDVAILENKEQNHSEKIEGPEKNNEQVQIVDKEPEKLKEKEEKNVQDSSKEKKESEIIHPTQENKEKNPEDRGSNTQDIKNEQQGNNVIEKKEEKPILSEDKSKIDNQPNPPTEKEITKTQVVEKQEPALKKKNSSDSKKEEKKQTDVKSRKPSDTPSDKSNKSGKSAKSTGLKVEKKESSSQNDMENKKKLEKKNSGNQSDIESKKKTDQSVQKEQQQKELGNEKTPIERKKTDESSKSRKGSEKSDTNNIQPQVETQIEKAATPLHHNEGEEVPQQNLEESVNAIFNFFSVTAKNIEEKSKETSVKIQERILNSHILKNLNKESLNSFITGNVSQNLVKAEKKITEVPKSPRNEKVLLEKVAVSGLKPAKLIKVEEDYTQIQSLKASPLNIQKKNDSRVSRSKQPKQETKAKNEIEEQIRQHKIQEITKLKKTLEAKLTALNDQLVELQQNTDTSSVSPPRARSLKKETKQEALEKQRKALEFTKKMLAERKNLEYRSEKRREIRQIQVMKDIEVLQNQQVHHAGVLKGVSQSVKEKLPGKKVYSKASATGFSALEERKHELRSRREFDKATDQNSGDERELSEVNVRRPKRNGPKKVVYKSPMLPSVLAWDEEQKRIEAEKISKRRQLKEKQVEYGREIKQSYLPKIQSKFDVIAKHKKGVYRSQDIETYLSKAGKEHLYGYVDKTKNRKTEDQSTKGSVKSHAYSQARNGKEAEEYNEKDNYDNLDAHPNVRYGKELMYELQDNWNLAEGTKSSLSREYSDNPHGKNNVRRSQPVNKGGYLVEEHEEPGRNSYPHKSNKKGTIRTRETEGDEEVGRLNQELMEEQLVLKDKISGMLSDIKQMENQVKRKEEKLLKEIERKSHGKQSP